MTAPYYQAGHAWKMHHLTMPSPKRDYLPRYYLLPIPPRNRDTIDIKYVRSKGGWLLPVIIHAELSQIGGKPHD